MTDWVSEGLKAVPEQGKNDASQPTPDYVGEAIRPAAPAAPNISNNPDMTASFGSIAGASFASNPTEAVRWYASRMYPGEPLEQAIKRFGVTSDGTIYHTPDMSKPDQAFRVVPDDWSLSSIPKRMATGVGPAIPAATSTVAGITTLPLAATGPLGMAGSVAATGGAGAAGEYGRQYLGDLLYGDEVSTRETNILPVIREGVEGGLGQGIGIGMDAWQASRQLRDFNRYNPQQTQRAYDLAERQGVPITPAEATNLSSLKGQQKMLANLPQTSDDMAEFYAKRDDLIFQKWGQFLDDITTQGDVDDVATRARSAAQKAIEDITAARSAAAGPHYQRAFDSGVPVDTDGLIDVLPDISKLRPGKVKSALQRALRAIADPVKDDDGKIIDWEAVTDLRQLHNAKIEIDAMLDAKGERAVDKTTRRYLTQLKRDLVDRMTQNADYKRGYDIFSAESGAVDDLINSSVRILSELKDENAIRAARTILDPGQRTPESVLRARRAIAQADPEAWKGLKRVFLQDNMTRAFRMTEGGDVLNPAGKLYKALNNPQQRAILRSAFTANEWKAFNDFMDVMQIASRVKNVGSDTAWNQEIVRETRNQARTMAGRVIENINPAALVRNVSNWLDERNFERIATKMMDAVARGDKTALAALKSMKQLKATNPRFWVLFGQLTTQTGGAVAADAVGETPIEPQRD